MASKRLRRLGFEADIKERLTRNGLLTCQVSTWSFVYILVAHKSAVFDWFWLADFILSLKNTCYHYLCTHISQTGYFF